jgi:hypothetical protein
VVAAPFWAVARRAVVPRDVGRAVLRVDARAVPRVEARAVLGDEDLVVPGDEARDVLRDAGEAGALVPVDLVPADLVPVDLDELELDGLEPARLEPARLAPARLAPAGVALACVAGDRVADARLAGARLAVDRLAVDRAAFAPAAPDRGVVACPAVLLLFARVRAGLESAALPLAAPVPVAFAAADLLAAFLLPDALLGGCVMGSVPSCTVARMGPVSGPREAGADRIRLTLVAGHAPGITPRG